MAKRKLEPGQFLANNGRVYQGRPNFFNRDHIDRLAHFFFDQLSNQHEYWQEVGPIRRHTFYQKAEAALEATFGPDARRPKRSPTPTQGPPAGAAPRASRGPKS